MDVLYRSPAAEPSRAPDGRDVLFVAVGAMASVCLRAAELLESRGIGCTVVDPRWVKPVDPGLPWLADEHRLVAVVEDNSRAAGVGSAVALALGDADVDVPVRRFGIPERFLAHAKRDEVLAEIGLTPAEIAGRISVCLAVRGELWTGASGSKRELAEAGLPKQKGEMGPKGSMGSKGGPSGAGAAKGGLPEAGSVCGDLSEAEASKEKP